MIKPTREGRHQAKKNNTWMIRQNKRSLIATISARLCQLHGYEKVSAVNIPLLLVEVAMVVMVANVWHSMLFSWWRASGEDDGVKNPNCNGLELVSASANFSCWSFVSLVESSSCSFLMMVRPLIASMTRLFVRMVFVMEEIDGHLHRCDAWLEIFS